MRKFKTKLNAVIAVCFILGLVGCGRGYYQPISAEEITDTRIRCIKLGWNTVVVSQGDVIVQVSCRPDMPTAN